LLVAAVDPGKTKKRARTVFSWYSRTSLQLALLEGLRIFFAPAIAVAMLALTTQLLDVRFTDPYIALAIITGLLCWIFLSREQPRRNGFFPSGLTVVGRISVGWLAVIMVLLFIGYATKTSHIFSRRALFLWFIATPPVLAAAALLLRQWFRATVVSSRHARHAVIVGASQMSRELARVIRERPELGLKLLALLDTNGRPAPSSDSASAQEADREAIRDYVNAHRIDVVFLTLPHDPTRTTQIIDELRDTTASVYLIPDLSVFDLIQARSDDIHGVPVIALCESPFQGLQGAAKRATDIAFATSLLVLASPIMIAIAIAIGCTSRGHVIFKQHRYGLDGERITVYKFRTMTVSENGGRVVQARRDDDRVTPLGRFLRRSSLDELPQLINVLQGRMSLVGPRPHAVAHNEEYRRLISGYMVRHKVAPGMTGLAQVNGCRGETRTLDDMKRRVHYDLEYIRHWCWVLDIKILFRTFKLLVKDKHAY
jgi:putative colanic acid biosynthesis UDP-glucose lipid carrier transferase